MTKTGGHGENILTNVDKIF